MENAIMKIEEVGQLPGTLTAAIEQNSVSIQKAVSYGETLLEKSKAGMNDDVDRELNDYLVKLRTTLTSIQERRKPITAMFDEIRGRFTALEAQIDPKRPESVYYKTQKVRDAYAELKAIAATEREAEIKKAQEKALEINSILFATKQHFQNECARQTANEYTRLYNGFQHCSLETFYEVVKQLQAHVPETLAQPEYPSIQARQHTPAEVVDMQVKLWNGLKTELQDTHHDTIRERVAAILMEVNSRKEHLHAMEKAGKEEKERLQKEAEARAEEEAKKTEEALAATEKKAAEEAEIGKQSAVADTLFNTAQQIDEGPAAPTNVREGYEIVVKNASGYLPLISFYFEKEGIREDPEKLEKKTIGAIKKFCEAWAKKTDEKVTSPALHYKPIYKAVAVKGK